MILRVIAAALFMAMAKTLLKAKARENIASPAEAVSVVNAELSRDNSAFLFITLFTCFYDPKSGQLAYTNAGHNPPLLKRDAEYGSKTVPLKEKDQLILFTDGVTEAMDVDDGLYGDKRLEQLMQAGSFESAEEIVDTIFTDVEKYATGAEQADDITVLTIKL